MSELSRFVMSIDIRANGVTVTAGIRDATGSELVELIENASSSALAALRMNAVGDITALTAIEAQTSVPDIPGLIEKVQKLTEEVSGLRLFFSQTAQITANGS